PDAAAPPAPGAELGSVPAPADPVTGEPAPPPMPSGDFRIVAVELDDAIDAEGRAVTPTLAFRRGDRIHASVVGVGGSQGLTLSARWFGPDGAEIANAGQSLVPDKPTVVTFAISQPQPWPVGEYRLEVAINQRVVETREFEVR
ncbi:hypothetical protein, partial [Arenimonas composti]